MVIPPELLTKLSSCAKTDFTSARDLWFSRQWWFSASVILGLVLEGGELWYEMVSVTRSRIPRFRYRIVLLESRVEYAKAAAIIGWIFIIVGLLGELKASSRIEDLSASIQECSDAKVREAMLEASEANERASKNEKEAAQLNKAAEDERLARIQLQERVAWRTISPTDIARIGSKLRVHRGIRIAVSTLAGNEEAVSFAEDVGAIFTTARWSFLGVVPMGNLGVQRFGLRISTTRDDPTRTAAQDLKRALNKLGFNPGYEESDQVFNGGGPGIYVFVELRPRVVTINGNAPSKP